MKNAIRLAALAALSVAAAAQAETPDPSGQFAPAVAAATPRAQAVQAQEAPRRGASPWSTQYNPLASFRSARSRAEVQADYLRSRDAVAAFTGEDSGSAFIAARQPLPDSARLAGQPRRAH